MFRVQFSDDDGDLPSPPRKQRRDKMGIAHELIQAKYDAGVPLFTKNLFLDAVRQFESRGRVSVTGFDGVVAYFRARTEEEYPWHEHGDNHRCIMYGYYLLPTLPQPVVPLCSPL